MRKEADKTATDTAKRPIRQLARYEIRPAALDKCLAAIREFVAYVRFFVFRDAAADQAHSESTEVKKFAAILYPECLAPVEFVDYTQVVANVEMPAR